MAEHSAVLSLKHKKTGIILAILLLLLITTAAVAIRIIWPGNKNTPPPPSANKPVVPLSPEKEAAIKDSDNDQLKDWEEALYGTDPKNPDTDSDGTPDGEEIKAGRNPLEKGRLLANKTWSDQLKLSDQQATSSSPFPNNNLTDQLGQFFVGSYLSKIQDGEAPANPEIMAQDIIDGFYGRSAVNFSFPMLNPREIKLLADDSPPAVKNYLNQTAALMQKHLAGLPDSLTIFSEALRTGDALNNELAKDSEFSRKLLQLEPLIFKYDSLIADLKNLPVPKSWANYHKRLTDSLLKFVTALRALRNADKDILKALLMLTPHQEALTELQNLRKEAEQELRLKKITFERGELANLIFGF